MSLSGDGSQRLNKASIRFLRRSIDSWVRTISGATDGNGYPVAPEIVLTQESILRLKNRILALLRRCDPSPESDIDRTPLLSDGFHQNRNRFDWRNRTSR